MLQFTWWQIKLLAKYQILTIAFVIAAGYTVAIKLLPVLQIDKVYLTMIFSDPTMLGFIFIGAMILFEKGDNTLEAQAVTPMRTSHYLWSKAIALLVPALIGSLAMIIAARGVHFRPIPFIACVVLSSLIFTFIGLAGAIKVRTLNQYIILIPLFLPPMCLPLINFYGLTNLSIFWVIPTHSTLYLLEQTVSHVFNFKEILNLLYLGLWTYLAYAYANYNFKKSLYK